MKLSEINLLPTEKLVPYKNACSMLKCKFNGQIKYRKFIHVNILIMVKLCENVMRCAIWHQLYNLKNVQNTSQ